MEFYQKLPRNKKEFALFIAVISIISVNIIAPVITCFEMGFSFKVWQEALKAIPLIWICVVALVLITYKPAEWLTGHIVAETDSFRACVLVNILCTVLLMSIFLTVIGTWIGSGHISLAPIRLFFYKWPRNFAISFAVEACVAQPLARLVMQRMHEKTDKSANEVASKQ